MHGKTRLRNNQLCVERDVKLCSLAVFDSGNFSGESRSGSEPSLSSETYRRAVQNDVIEMWFYLRSQLTEIHRELERSSQNWKNADTNVDSFELRLVLKRLTDVIDTGADYKRSVLTFMQFSMFLHLHN